MTVVLPRLDRAAASALLEQHRHQPLPDVARCMPARDISLTYAAVGGRRIEEATLRELRERLLELATKHGFPDGTRAVSEFEGSAARLVREMLEMTPHEASLEEVWSYVTCCWLLDIAFWRFGSSASDDRFIGHINRNTFRRMWWRAEVLGADLHLGRLGEDELVNIMERPTLFADRRVARSIAREFLLRVDRDQTGDRMRLMREATKRLLRLTPFVSFAALDQAAVDLIIADAFDVAAGGLAGETAAMPARRRWDVPAASPELVEVTQVLRTPVPVPADGEVAGSAEFEELAQAAVDIARRTGRVTNMTLREAAAVTPDEAREVLTALVKRRELVRRGAKRGTHYVLPEPSGDGPVPEATPAASPPGAPALPTHSGDRSADSALRRLLRRGG